MLRDASALSESDPEQVEHVLLRRWSFDRETTATKFRVRLLGIHSEVKMQCAELDRHCKIASPGLEDDALPFGLGFAQAERPKRPRRPLPEPRPGPGSGSGSDAGLGAGAGIHAAADVPSCNDGESSPESAAADDEADDAAAEELESDDQGLRDEVWNSTGIKDKDVAPVGARAKCELCGARIMPGQVRFDYRFRVSDKLGDQKRIHATCCSRLPADTRLRDIAQLKAWLRAGDLAHDVATAVEAALAELRAAV